MKKMLMRPTAALFPAVLLTSALLGDRYMAINLYFHWVVMQLCSLCSAGAFRNAAAREPGIRRVDRRFSGSWITIVLGMLLVLAYTMWISGGEPLNLAVIGLPIAVGCISIEQSFEERMFALSRRTDGVVLSLIANALLLAGLLLDGSGGITAPVAMDGFYTACAAVLGVSISIAANYIIEPMHAFSLKPVNIVPFAPVSALQDLLYPLAMLLLPGSTDNGGCILAGMILWRLSRTVCRRSHDESRRLNLLLVATAAAMTAANLWIPGLDKYAAAMIVAMICAEIVFCAPGWRLYAGTALSAGAYALQKLQPLPQTWILAAVIVLCTAAVILNLHKAFLRKV